MKYKTITKSLNIICCNDYKLRPQLRRIRIYPLLKRNQTHYPFPKTLRHSQKSQINSPLVQSNIPPTQRDDLIRVFKQYYENENVFFTKINNIANSQVKKGDEDGWITNKKVGDEKVKANRRKEKERERDVEEVESKFKDYSFLKDEKCM